MYDTLRPIWLLFSHDKMDLDTLTNSIKEAAQKILLGKELSFALIWTAIRDGTRSYPKNANKNRPKELTKEVHIEIAKEDLELTKKILSTLYGNSATSYPLEIKMRYVTTINHNITLHAKRDILRLKQCKTGS